jgi:hypothetical protein
MMGRGKPPNALRAKGVEKGEEEQEEIRFLERARLFSLSHRVQSESEVQPPYQMGIWGSFPERGGGKLPGREADHLPQFNAEVKNAWSSTSTLTYVFMALYVLKHRGNFILRHLQFLS